MKTLTPEIVADMCKPFLGCAAFYHTLMTFVEERRNLPFGPTHQVHNFIFLDNSKFPVSFYEQTFQHFFDQF